MADLPTIVRLWRTSFFCLTTIGAGLTWWFTPSMALADAPLQENHPVVSPPTIDSVWTADRRKDRPIAHGSMSPGGRDGCFSIDDQRVDQSGSQGLDDKRTWLMPLTVVCADLLAADEIGWSGYEARGDHARSLGNWAEAEKAYSMAVGLLSRASDKEVNQDLAALLNKLGSMRFKQGDFAGSETLFRRALTIYTLTQGSEDFHVADTLDLVASALFEQPEGRALAGPLFYRAWVIREGKMRPDHPAIADSLHHMAVSLYSDNLSLAIPLLLRSKKIREKVFGHDHPMVANSLDAMARLYEAHNHRDLAIPLYQEALTIQEKIFGPNASETLTIRSSLNMDHGGKDHLHKAPNGRE